MGQGRTGKNRPCLCLEQSLFFKGPGVLKGERREPGQRKADLQKREMDGLTLPLVDDAALHDQIGTGCCGIWTR